MKSFWWLIVLGIFGWVQVARAEPVLDFTEQAKAGGYSAKLEAFIDDALQSESCGGYAYVDFTNPALNFKDRQKFCGGGLLQGFKVGNSALFFVQLIGGSGAGWSLYRYNPLTRKVDFYDFDCREIHVTKVDKEKAYLTIHYEQRPLHGGGYDPDKITKWIWLNNAPSPTQIK